MERMCFICDGGTHEELLQRVERGIDEVGWFLYGVEAGRERGLWVHTIGLTERFAHPELIVTDGCCDDCAAGMLRQLATQVRDGRAFAVGDEVVSASGTGRARFGPVHPRQWQTDRFALWRQYYSTRPWAPEPIALQVITLQSGRWQDDPTNPRWRHHRLDRTPHLAGRPGRFHR
jgi:Domain of unknown function (DUF4262)